MKLSEAQLTAKIEKLRSKLLSVRNRRIPPLRDEKVITAWNGLAITGLARLSRISADPKYLRAAIKAATCIEKTMITPAGSLRRSRFGNAVNDSSVLDDYAYLTEAFFELFFASQETKWLRLAHQFEEQTRKNFYSAKEKTFFRSPTKRDGLFVRAKAVEDGARPAAAGVALVNCLRIAHLTDNRELLKLVSAVLENEAELLARYPFSFATLLKAYLTMQQKGRDILVVGPDMETTVPFLKRCLRRSDQLTSIVLLTPERAKQLEFLPNFIASRLGQPATAKQETQEQQNKEKQTETEAAGANEKDSAKDNSSQSDSAKRPLAHKSVFAETRVIICEDQRCQLPITNVADLEKALD